MRTMLYWLYGFGLLFLMGCKAPTGGKQGELIQPPWLDVKISFEHLPGTKSPAEVVFDVTVTGTDSGLYVSHQGDTLNLLYMKFASSNWVKGLNTDADTLWQGKVEVGDRIVLKPVFWIDSSLIPVDTFSGDIAIPVYGDTTTHFWSWLGLSATFHSATLPEINANSLFPWGLGYTLHFDYRTGDYSIDTD